MTMTKQEMFDKAVRGLRSQGWEQSIGGADGTSCLYDNGEGKHCAWGWVDEGSWDFGSIPLQRMVSHDNYGGVATCLSDDDLQFARQLQWAHDDVDDGPKAMEVSFRKLAAKHSLTFPEE